MINNIPSFSSFAKKYSLDGEKISIKDVLDKQIIITNFKIGASRFQKECLTLQFCLNQQDWENKNYNILFTGSTVLISLLKEYEKNIPFSAMIIKKKKYYTFI